MTPESPVDAPAWSVVIDGETPAAAILLSRLVSAGVPAHYAEQRVSGLPVRRTVTASTHQAMQDGGLESRPLATVAHRALAESAFIDSPGPARQLFMVRAAPGADALPRPSTRSRFIVEAALPPRGLASLVPEDVAVELELIWSTPDETGSTLFTLSGEHLDEISGAASLISGFGATSLLLVVPMQVLVVQSIAIIDIGWRLLNHPGVAELVPNRPPDDARTALRRTRPIAVTERYSSSKLILESDSPGVNPAAVDGSIRSALAAAQAIQQAATEDRWTAAHFSGAGAQRD